MEYTHGQRECMNEFSKWWRRDSEQLFQYDGPAGTGKTTIAPEMIRRSGLDIETEVLSMAFTGRAASNLTLKGIPASSMHASLLDWVEKPKTDANGDIIYINGRPLTTMEFQKKNFLPKSIKLMLIDEGGFVDRQMGEIAMSFGIPVCVMGDREQLGPPFGKPYFLQKTDYSLTEITRQAKDSGIIELATRLRLNQEIPNRMYSFKDQAFIIPKAKITDTILLNSDIILCAKNKTRNYFNRRIREDLLGIKSPFPVKGDKIMCRRNYWNRKLGDIALTNGVIGYVLHEVSRDDINWKERIARIDFQPDYIDWDYYDNIPLDIDFFASECGPDKADNRFHKGIKFELAHAITTHIAQGSEFDSVMYWDEPSPLASADDLRRLRYTAATRAKKILTYAI